MKAWQIFAVGVAVLVAALLLPSYEPMLAGLAALAMLVVVVMGFLFRPQKDVFYLQTTIVVSEPDYPLSVEHDRIAVRIEVARLWLLFLPTFGAMAFLITTFSRRTTWSFSLLDQFWELRSYPVFLGIRMFLLVVVGLLCAWVSERWVLRDADACSADSVTIMGGRLVYSFKDRFDEYYGGEAFPFPLVRSPNLASIVLYRPAKPELNKIAMGCLFHRPVIVGRGLTDLDEATVSTHSLKAQPASL